MIALFKRKLLTLSPIVVTLLIISCGGSDEQPNPDTKQLNCVLSNFTSTQSDLTASNIRDTSGKIIQIDYTGESFSASASLEYDDSEKLVKIISADNIYSTLSYNSNGLVSRETRYYQQKGSEEFYIERTIDFFYDESKRLVKDSTSSSYSFIQLKRYEYMTDDNLARIFTTTDTKEEYLSGEYLEYDNRISPFWQHNLNYIYFKPLNEVGYVVTTYVAHRNKNNPVSFRNPSYSITYSYETDNDGYITGSTTSFDEIHYEFTYQYDCQ